MQPPPQRTIIALPKPAARSKTAEPRHDPLLPVSQQRKWPRAGLILLAALHALWSSPARADTAAELRTVQILDARLAAVMHRLTSSNSDKCPAIMPGTGFVLHTLEQYAPELHESARQAFGFETSLAVAVIVPGSPAELAGLKTNDSILAINGTPPRDARPDEAGTSGRRDEIERTIAALPAEAPIRLTVQRNGLDKELTIVPVPACRTRFEVLHRPMGLALSDGETIQVSARFVTLADPLELAAIAAHELAHTALEHNRKLEAQGVDTRLRRGSRRDVRAIRAAEDEADRASVAMLLAAGYDPQIAPGFWRGRGRKLGGGILREPTHAKPAERARLLDFEIARLTVPETRSPAVAPQTSSEQGQTMRR